jgi:hypothetical protein
MANQRTRNRRTRAYRGGSGRTSGSGALMDTVRNTITQFTGNRGGGGRGRASRGSRGGAGGLASQATGFIGGLLSGGDAAGRSRGRRRR